jgi:hypothetical protein
MQYYCVCLLGFVFSEQERAAAAFRGPQAADFPGRADLGFHWSLHEMTCITLASVARCRSEAYRSDSVASREDRQDGHANA